MIISSRYDLWLIFPNWEYIIWKNKTTWIFKEAKKWKILFFINDIFWNRYIIDTNKKLRDINEAISKWNFNFTKYDSWYIANVNIPILTKNDIEKYENIFWWKTNLNFFYFPVAWISEVIYENIISNNYKNVDINKDYYLNINEWITNIFLFLNSLLISFINYTAWGNKKSDLFYYFFITYLIYLNDFKNILNQKIDILNSYFHLYLDVEEKEFDNIIESFLSFCWEMYKLFWQIIQWKTNFINNLWKYLDKTLWKKSKKYYIEEEIKQKLNKFFELKNEYLKLLKLWTASKTLIEEIEIKSSWDIKNIKNLAANLINYLIVYKSFRYLVNNYEYLKLLNLNSIEKLNENNINKFVEKLDKIFEDYNLLVTILFYFTYNSFIKQSKYNKLIIDWKQLINQFKIEDNISIDELYKKFIRKIEDNNLKTLLNEYYKLTKINNINLNFFEKFYLINQKYYLFFRKYLIEFIKRWLNKKENREKLNINKLSKKIDFVCRLDIKSFDIDNIKEHLLWYKKWVFSEEIVKNDIQLSYYTWIFDYNLWFEEEISYIKELYKKYKDIFKEKDDFILRYLWIRWIVNRYFIYLFKNFKKINLESIKDEQLKNKIKTIIDEIEKINKIKEDKKSVLLKQYMKVKYLMLNLFIEYLFPIWNYINDYIEIQKKIKWWENISKSSLLEIIKPKINLDFINIFSNVFLYENTTHTKKWYLSDLLIEFEYEYFVISFLWYSSYFLVVSDYVNYWKTNNVAVWPSRWSAWWVLISYLLNIIDIDPKLYELSFERMIHIYKPQKIFYAETEEERKEKWIIYDNEELEDSDILPDIDVDFWDRTLIYNYVKKRFWENRVAKIWTVLTMKIKSAFKELSRNTWIDFEILNIISQDLEILYKNYIDEDESNPWEKIYKLIKTYIDTWEWLEKLSDSWKEYIKKYWHILKPVFNSLKYFLDKAKGLWVHACWVVISNYDLYNFTWLREDVNSSLYITELEKKEIMWLWLIKYDFLSLESIQIIKEIIQTILFNREKERNLYAPELNKFTDKKQLWQATEFYWRNVYLKLLDKVNEKSEEVQNVYEIIFQNAITNSIFQFESEWIKNTLKLIKPTNIEDLSAVSALYRPWPMQFIPTFANYKHWIKEFILFDKEELEEFDKKINNREEVEKTIKILDEIHKNITKVTYNTYIYQEQIINFFALSWINFKKVDTLRKKIHLLNDNSEEWEKIREIFNDALKNFIKKYWVNEYIFRKYVEKYIINFAWYAFNKSHSMAYSLISFIMWYLKLYYPQEFFTITIRHNTWNIAKINWLIDEANKLMLLLKWTNSINSIFELYIPPTILYSKENAIVLNDKDLTKKFESIVNKKIV